MGETCPGCGLSVSSASNFCVHCGKSLEVADAPPHDESETSKEPRSWREGVWKPDTPQSPNEPRSWKAGVWKPDAPEVSGPELLGEPQSWNEWLKRPFRGKWTWRDWTFIGASVSALLLIGYIANLPSESSDDNRELLFVVQVAELQLLQQEVDNYVEAGRLDLACRVIKRMKPLADELNPFTREIEDATTRLIGIIEDEYQICVDADMIP